MEYMLFAQNDKGNLAHPADVDICRAQGTAQNDKGILAEAVTLPDRKTNLLARQGELLARFGFDTGVSQRSHGYLQKKSFPMPPHISALF